MALSKIDVANMVTGATPVANGGTGQTTFAAAGLDKRPNAKPIIINGDMVISQRSTSVTGIGDGDEGYHTIDRFKFEEGNSPSAVWTMTQESLTSGNAYNAGFKKALKMDCTTSDDASGHGDILNVIKYATEQHDTHFFKKGTANAEKYTVAFWIKATKTGTHICELRDSTNDRACSVAYTVSTTNTWEHKVLNFPADTTGATGTATTKGLEIYWSLYSGSGYQGATLQTAWGGSATNARYTGQVNNADSTSNNWHLTGVQLEVGEYSSTTLPPFQHESYGENLLRCQRYFQHIVSGNHKLISYAHWASGSQITFILNILEMRAVPTIDYDNGNDYWAIGGSSGSTNTIDNLIIDGYSTNKCVGLYSGTAAGGTTGYAYYGFSDNASARLALVSEL
jgi:hypothetical protein